MEIFYLKNKAEPWLFFKWLKLFAIFLGSWAGTWAVLFIFLIIPGPPVWLSKIFLRWFSTHRELTADLILYFGILCVLYYVFTKVRRKSVEKFTFDDSKGLLRIDFRNYYLHFRSNTFVPYNKLYSSIETRTHFLYGANLILTILKNSKKVAVIDEAASDWQRQQETLSRINDKITSITLKPASAETTTYNQ